MATAKNIRTAKSCTTSRLATARATSKPFSVGSEVKSSDGTPARLCRSMRAPFWVCHQGRVVADYGDDEDAAWEHYDALAREQRNRRATGRWAGPAA